MRRQFYYTLENARVDTADAEEKLSKAGYPPVGEWQGGGGGFMTVKDKLVIEGSGYGEGSQTAVGDYETHAGQGHGGAAVGYILKETRLFRLYPLIGMGGGGGGIAVSDAAQRSKPAFEIGGGSALLWAGIGVDLCLPLVSRLRLIVGLRAGVQIPVGGDKAYRYRGIFTRWNIGIEWHSDD